jgi:hypothetical protein
VLDGWIINSQHIAFPAFGDAIDSSTNIIMGTHCTTMAVVEPLSIITPPTRRCLTISDFVYEKFNEHTYAVSFSRTDIDTFSPDDELFAIEPHPLPPPRTRYHSKLLYNLLPKSDPYKMAIGAGVYDPGHLIPPLAVKTADTDNIFDTLFGIEFKYMNATLVRQFSGFGFGNDLARKLALRTNIHLLTNAIPSFTSVTIFDCIRDRLN